MLPISFSRASSLKIIQVSSANKRGVTQLGIYLSIMSECQSFHEVDTVLTAALVCNILIHIILTRVIYAAVKMLSVLLQLSVLNASGPPRGGGGAEGVTIRGPGNTGGLGVQNCQI